MAFRPARGTVESRLSAFLGALDLGEREVLIVAYSGGPDSAALLAAAAALRPGPLLAVHVDHGLRPQAEREAERRLVMALCARLGVRLTIARVRPGSVSALAARRQVGIEAAAREYRYRVLKKLMEREASSHVLLAHTGDDQVETVLMRLLGGSGSAGLRGMAAVNPPWYRPFLGLGKSELLDYDLRLGLSYSTDSTNASIDYLRNRVRLRLMPFLDRDFPGWRRGLSHTIERARLDSQAIGECARAIAFRPAADGTFAVEADAFLAMPESCRLASLVEAVGSLTGRSRLSLRMARAALAALGPEARGSYRGGGIALCGSNDAVLLRRGLDFPRRGGYFVVIDGACRVRAGRYVVEAMWTSSAGQGIRSDAFRFPIIVRSRRPGDSIEFNGGGKRLDDLFSEWGLSAESRAAVPVVEDRDGIVAVLGSTFGAKDRYRELAKAKGGAEPRLAVIVKGV